MSSVWAGLLFWLTACTGVRAALPDGWKVCPKGDGQTECLKGAIMGAVHTLVNGNDKLGFRGIDPFKVGPMKVFGDPSGPVAMEIKLKDFTIHNLDKVEITSIELKGRNLKIKGILKDKLVAKSPYVLTGNILTMPLQGEGPGDYALLEPDLLFDLTFRETPEVRDGKEYLVVEKFIQRSEPRGMMLNFENMFNGNAEMSKQMNAVMNENWSLMWQELRGVFEDHISEEFRKYSNEIFSKIPVNDFELF